METNQTIFIEWAKSFVPQGYADAIQKIGSITDSPEGFKEFIFALASSSAKYLRSPDTEKFNENINLANRNLPVNTYTRVNMPLILRPVRNGGPSIITTSTKEVNQRKFMEWLKGFAPTLYTAAVSRAGTLNGWFDWFGDITGALVDFAPQYLQFQGQKEMLDIQLDRAREGQPPLQQAGYQPGYVQPTGVPYVQPTGVPPIGVPPIAPAGIDWKEIMPWLLGGGVLLGFMMMRR